MPDNQALQVFYGTLPLIFVIAGAFLRSQTLLKDILTRLNRLEAELGSFKNEVRTELGHIKERLVSLETRAGFIFSKEETATPS